MPNQPVPTPPHSQVQTVQITPAESSRELKLIIGKDPIIIQSNSATDWPSVAATTLVGVGSIATAIIVALITYRYQLLSVRASIASYRHKWIEELREAASRMFEITAKIKIEFIKDPEYSKSESIKIEYSQLFGLQAKIELMLDNSKPHNRELVELMNKMINVIKDGDSKEFATAINTCLEKMHYVLELAWQDMKSDLRK